MFPFGSLETDQYGGMQYGVWGTATKIIYQQIAANNKILLHIMLVSVWSAFTHAQLTLQTL